MTYLGRAIDAGSIVDTFSEIVLPVSADHLDEI